MSTNTLSQTGAKQVIARLCACALAAMFASLTFCGPAAAARLQVLHEFTGSDGADPTGGLPLDPTTGTLYGTAIFGGGGDGTVFSLTPPPPGGRRWKFQVLYQAVEEVAELLASLKGRGFEDRDRLEARSATRVVASEP
jgi:hypothetical protein